MIVTDKDAQGGSVDLKFKSVALNDKQFNLTVKNNQEVESMNREIIDMQSRAEEDIDS